MTRSFGLLFLSILLFVFLGFAIIIACGDDDDDDTRGVPYYDDDVDDDDDFDDDANDDTDDDTDDDADDDADDDSDDDSDDDIEGCHDPEFTCPWGDPFDEPLEGAECIERVCTTDFFNIILNECPEEMNPDNLDQLGVESLCSCFCDNGCFNDCMALAYEQFNYCDQLIMSLNPCIGLG